MLKLKLMQTKVYLLALALPLAAQVQPPPKPPVPAMPENVIYEPNIQYSNVGGKLELDVVRPKGAGPFPGVLCIHGGGFRRGNRESYLPLCIKLAQRGYVAATVSYRLSPVNQFPAPVEDVKASVRWMRAHASRFSLDPDRICATGGSAGGHLALFLGLTAGIREFEGSGPHLDESSRVSCVVDYYGPTDFTKSYGKSVDAAEVLPLFLGGDLDHARKAHVRASPLNWVTPSAAPVLAVHGTVDRYVEHAQSVWLVDRLRAAGVHAELETIEGSDHGFKGADADRAEKRMFDFLDKRLAKKNEIKIVAADHGPGGEVLGLLWPSGKVLWRVPNFRGHDVQSLPNGNVLYTMGPKKTVAEMDAQQRTVWSYGPDEGLVHPITAERLGNGNTLIGDARLGRVIEVDPRKKIVWKYENADMANMRMRNCRRTDAGTTLISIERAGKIVEVNRAGEIVWTFAPGEMRLPYKAIRMQNGNTIVGMTNPGEIVEVDKAGKIVRSAGGQKMDVQFGWVSGMALLPGGNLLISDYTGRRLAEVDKKGAIVRELRTGPWTIASVAVVE